MMTRATLSRLFSLVFFLAILATALVYNMNKPRVMVLQSYNPEYAWTRDVDVGLHRVIDDWTDCSVTWHYMDTKQHSDPQWPQRAGIVARRAIRRINPRVLIAVDDPAQSLAARHFVGRPDMEIVFAGVNGSAEPYGYPGAANVTGIFERKQLDAVRETILALESRRPSPNPTPSLAYILDPSPSLQAGRQRIDAFHWSPIVYKGSHAAQDLEDWEKAVLETSSQTDYILVANYRKLLIPGSRTEYADAREVMAWTEAHSTAPVIGINAFNVEDGAMISIGVSPFEQGEVAATMAREILDKGVRAGTIPMRESHQYVVAIRESSLEMRHLKLPAIYEAFGRATENFIEKEP